MNKMNNKMQLLLLSVMLLGMAACTGDFEDINRNPNEVTDDQLQANNYKVGTNIKTLQGLVVPTEEHRFQFVESIVGCPYAGYNGKTVDTWQATFENYNPSADWRKVPFVDMISDTYPAYRAIINGTDDAVAQALAKLFRIAIMHRVTDSYGPIPYTQIMENKTESLEVAYDTQEQVYTQMFAEMDEVIAAFKDNLTLPSDAFARYDAVYYGNVSQWLKFANSLKLRMAMRLSYVDEATAKSKAAEAIAEEVIEANADNASMHTTDNRTTLIYNDWGDHRIGADIINYMNGYNDPRREKMFTTVKLVEDGQEVQGYAGIRIGINVTSKSTAISSYSNMLVTSTDPYLWMNAAEVTFLRAEYELRWGSAETAKSLYEQAIRLSFEERGASGADTYVADATSQPAAYKDPLNQHSVGTPQSTITIAWETGTGEDVKERNLERIITQKWIAIFPLGTEAWTEHRRTGYPRLLPVVVNNSGGAVDSEKGARRLPYPVEEYTENLVNLQDAVSKLNSEAFEGSGDNMGTRVWWDRRNLNE